MTSATQDPSRALIVLGMHRSGTSAFARCLNLLGAGIGEKLIEANWGNERGFWEDEDVVEVDKALLAAAGLAWHDVAPLPTGWLEREGVRAARARAVEIARREGSRHRLWVVKDPRMCRLVPLWRHAIEEAGGEPLWLLAVRSPAEVAASQARRDGFSPEKSNLLWLRHVLESELETRGSRRALVRYDDLLADWRALLARVARELDVVWPVPLDAAAARIEEFLSRRLRHFAIDDRLVAHDPRTSRWVREVYEALDERRGEPEAQRSATLDRVRGEVEAADAVFVPLLRAAAEEGESLRATVASEHAGWSAALGQLDGARAEIGRLSGEIGRLEAEVEQGQRRLAEASAEARARLEALRARARGLAELVEAYRGRRVLRLIDRFRSVGDLSSAIAPAFRQLLDDSHLFGAGLRGWALAPSESLHRLPWIEYELDLARPGLCAVLLAPALDLPLCAGELEIEIGPPRGEPLRRARISATELREDAPARLCFDAIPESRGRRLSMRVRAVGVDGPLRLFQWVRPALGGLGPRCTRPFCGFEFGEVGARA